MKKITLLLFLITVFSLYSVSISAPDNPSSLPLIIAADNIDELVIDIFSNHTQAHSLFMSGRIDLLMTGYAVGESFALRGVPVKLIASWVNGMNYLVTADTVYADFTQLKGQKIYFPFQGSPIEKMSLWLAEQEGLRQSDWETGYLPFVSMLQLMRQGQVKNAVMPVSSALKIVDNKSYFLSFDLNDKWQEYTNTSFYPQVCLFARDNNGHQQLIARLLNELQNAVDLINSDPQSAIDIAAARLSYSPEIISKSLELYDFELLYGKELQTAMDIFYEKSGGKQPPAAFYSTD